MFSQLEGNVSFFSSKYRYVFNNGGYKHHIVIERKLTEDEEGMLWEILKSFPDGNRSPHWGDEFHSLNLTSVPSELLKYAANAKDDIGNTMLGVAAFSNDVKAVQQLIDFGANVNAPDSIQKTAIYWAISRNAEEAIKCLIANGASLDVTYENLTPLQYAKDRGYKKSIRVIENFLGKQEEKISPKIV